MPLPPPPPMLPVVATPRAPLIPAWALLRRNRHVTVPLTVPFAFAAAGVALAVTPKAAVPVAAGAAVLAATVWWAASHKWDRAVEQWYARASVTAAGGWLVWAAAAGVRTWAWLAVVLAAGSVAWGIPWWWHKRPRRQPSHITEQWNTWWMYYAAGWQLAGSHVLNVTTKGVIDTLHVQLWAGRQHARNVADALPLIESALQGHVEAGMTRVEHVRGNPSQVHVHLKRANPHSTEIAWDPALAPATITASMPLGKNESGEWERVPCLRGNWFIIGVEGGGKSNELSVILGSITHCPDALVWVIDRKGGKAARPWLGAIDWVATTTEEARLMLTTLEAEVRARALHAYDGNEQLTPSPEVPAIFLVIDEAHNVISEMSGDRECQQRTAAVASEGRASAIRVIVLTQYGALHESVGTEQIRGNLKNRICFRVAEAAHGQFALDDWKNLDASKLENPGEFYYRLEGRSSSAPLRGPHMPHPLVREIAARHALIPRPPLRLYASAYQAIYDARYDRVPAQFRPAPPPPEATMMTSPAPAPETPEMAAQRIEDELATIPDLAAPPPVDEEVLRQTIDGRKRLWARLLQEAPPGGISPAQLTEGSGMSRSWTHQQLAALITVDVITKLSDGRYSPLPGQDVWAALEMIKDGAARLADHARQLVGA